MFSETLESACVKINIGSGLFGIPGWHNLDNSPTIPLSRIPVIRRLLKTPAWPRDVQRYDVRRGLRFADRSVQYIYSSHTFENFTYAEALAIAKDCYRVLAPQGILRVVVSDSELIGRDHPGRNDHPRMFESKDLVGLLRLAGFQRVEVSIFGMSGIPEIAQLEPEVRRRESLYVEAVK